MRSLVRVANTSWKDWCLVELNVSISGKLWGATVVQTCKVCINGLVKVTLLSKADVFNSCVLVLVNGNAQDLNNGLKFWYEVRRKLYFSICVGKVQWLCSNWI